MSKVKFRAGSFNEKALEYFTDINETTLKRKCKIGTCSQWISASNASNMSSHIKHPHPMIYAENFEKNNKNSKYYELKYLEFMQNCTEMVTKNGRPFKCLSDSGFKKIVESELKELADKSFVININDKNHPKIKRYIKEVASKVREHIKLEVCRKHVSLMTDTTTKNTRTILGISIQFIADT